MLLPPGRMAACRHHALKAYFCSDRRLNIEPALYQSTNLGTSSRKRESSASLTFGCASLRRTQACNLSPGERDFRAF